MFGRNRGGLDHGSGTSNGEKSTLVQEILVFRK